MASFVLPRNASAALSLFGEPHLHTDGELLLLTFAPDGSLLSLEEQGVLRRWNALTGQQTERHSLSDLETLWCFSNDARVLTSASDDLTIWDASSGSPLTGIPQESWVMALAFHPDAGFVATGHEDGSISFWDVPGHHRIRTLRHHTKPISTLAVSPDGKRLAAASEDRRISLWDLKTGNHLGDLAGHTDRIPALAWHPGGELLVSAGWDTTARVWDSRSLQPVVLFNAHATQVTALAFSKDGSRLACADSALDVRVRDFDKRKPLHILKGAQVEVRSLAFSPDGKRLAATGDRTIHLWDPATGQPLAGSGPRPVSRTRLALSPDGKRLVSNGGGSAVRIWDTAARTVLLDLPTEQPVHDVAYSPDGKRIAGAAGATVRLWDGATGKVLGDWDGPHEPVTTVVFSGDGALLASCGRTGQEVWLWRATDGEPVLLIPDALAKFATEALAFHPAGKLLAVGGVDWLATGGSDGAISLWDVDQRAEVASFLEGCTALAFDATGARLASTSLVESVCIWDVAGQSLQAELLGHEGTVTAVACSPDGKLLASAGEDYTLRLWDAQGKELAVLEVESQVTALAFAPDGRFLYTAHANTTCGQLAVADALRKG